MYFFKEASRNKESIRNTLIVLGIKQHFQEYLPMKITIHYVAKCLNSNVILQHFTEI